MITTHPRQTSVRNFIARSTTSIQTSDTAPVSKRRATGISWRIPSASWSTSAQRSLSSPDLQVRLRKAKAKERAARAPTLARPDVARLPRDSLALIQKRKKIHIIKLIGKFSLLKYFRTAWLVRELNDVHVH